MVPKFRDIWFALAIVTVAACAQFNPVAQAETRQQKAFAAYGTLVVGVEQIAELLRPDTLPDPVQRQLVAVAERASAVAKAGLAAYFKSEEARVQFEKDASTQGAFAASVQSLDTWLTEAEPVVRDLKAAIRGAQQ